MMTFLALMGCIPPHMLPPPGLPTEPMPRDQFVAQVGDKSQYPLDCLADVCLGDTPPEDLVREVDVAGRTMRRTAVVCGDRVMRVYLSHSWGASRFMDDPEAWWSHDGGDFDKAKDAFQEYRSVLSDRGWEEADAWVSEVRRSSYGGGGEQETGFRYVHPQMQGTRKMTGTYAWNYQYHFWTDSRSGPGIAYFLEISTHHPDARQVCVENSGL